MSLRPVSTFAASLGTVPKEAAILAGRGDTGRGAWGVGTWDVAVGDQWQRLTVFASLAGVGDQVESDDELGRRERKKRETRQALVETAMALFAEQGVDGTTIEQISDGADVSERTFYRYFATKEDVLFADSIERRERFATALATRPEDTGPAPFSRSHFVACPDRPAPKSRAPGT